MTDSYLPLILISIFLYSSLMVIAYRNRHDFELTKDEEQELVKEYGSEKIKQLFFLANPRDDKKALIIYIIFIVCGLFGFIYRDQLFIENGYVYKQLSDFVDILEGYLENIGILTRY